MKKILILIFLTIPLTNLIAKDSDRFISATGKNYTEARTSAVKIAQQQGLRVVNYNYSTDRTTGNCTIVIRASAYKPRYYINNNTYTSNRKLAIAIQNQNIKRLRSTPLPGTNYRPVIK